MELSEASTRRERIDPKLAAAGWKVISFRAGLYLANCNECAIAEYPTDNGPADYALCVAGRILGVVEAKKLTLGPQNVLTQAERYSRGVKSSPFNFGGLRVPFLYSTNGEVIWYHDIRHPKSRSYKVTQFHTPAALTERLDRDFENACSKLAALPNNQSRLRDYQVEAISILLERPRNWSVAALSELRNKLASAPEHFTEENLRLAHQVHYHKALVEIISMVKHAVREQEPLLTAEERVRQALAKVTAGREFTVEQAKWLDRIKSHLIENLSISQDDFSVVPVLSDPGGWGRADKDFNHRLDELLRQLNEAVAA